jgi:hypothetical protein
MKIYEYLAAGLEVVATPLPSLRQVRGVTTVADAAEAAAHLRTVSRRRDDASRRARSELAAGHTWSARLVEIADAIEAVN